MNAPQPKILASWEISFPLVTNRFFLYYAAKILYIGFPATAYILFMLIALLFFVNRYPARFTLTDAGVRWEGLSGFFLLSVSIRIEVDTTMHSGVHWHRLNDKGGFNSYDNASPPGRPVLAGRRRPEMAHLGRAGET